MSSDQARGKKVAPVPAGGKTPKGCYRDPRTGQFVCPPGQQKPKGKPGTKPAPAKPGAKPQPKRGRWFPMPDQLNDRYPVASRRKPPTTA